MKRYIAFFSALILATASITGCAQLNTPQGQAQANQAVQYGLVAAQVADALVTAQAQVTLVEKELTDNKDKFTPAQWAQLQATDTQIQGVLKTIKDLENMPSNSAAGNAATILVNASQLYATYGQTKAMYLTARQIVATQYASLTPIEQYNLSSLDNSAKAIDSAVQTLSTAAPGTNMTPLIISALQVAALAAKVALAAGA